MEASLVKKSDKLAEETANEAPDVAIADDEETTAVADDQSAELKAEAKKNLDGWQRTLAEFQNYRRRIEREQQDMRERIQLDVLKTLLPIIDDFERAMATVPEEIQEDPWINGVNLVHSKLTRILEDHNIEPVDPVGEPFDPNLHQAIAMDESDDVDSGHIIETMQKGYMSGDIMLRPALVRVAQ